jgi:hypothetical protein
VKRPYTPQQFSASLRQREMYAEGEVTVGKARVTSSTGWEGKK